LTSTNNEPNPLFITETQNRTIPGFTVELLDPSPATQTEGISIMATKTVKNSADSESDDIFLKMRRELYIPARSKLCDSTPPALELLYFSSNQMVTKITAVVVVSDCVNSLYAQEGGDEV